MLNLLIAGSDAREHPSKQKAFHVRDVPRVQRSSEHPCQGAVENITVPTENGLVLCMVPTDKDLIRKLKDIGSFNKHYVAVTEEEANDFENLLPTESANKEVTTFPIIWSQRKDTISSVFSGSWIRRRDDKPESETQASEEGENIVNSVKTRCVKRGSRTEKNMIRLCTECQRISELSFDRFPRYINEITCDIEGLDLQRESLFCERNQGLCFQRYLLIDLLMMTDNYVEVTSPNPDMFFKAYEQIWEPYTQKIRTCCECQLFE